jgi:rhodanese-related sulfurtransferase
VNRLLLLFSVVLLLVSCKGESADQVQDVSESAEKVEEPKPKVRYIDVNFARGLIRSNQGLTLIDVRTPEEHEEGHIEGSVVYNVRADDFAERIDSLDKNETYLIYCRSGSRSQRAIDKMTELGFMDLYMLNGGYLDWSESEK